MSTGGWLGPIGDVGRRLERTSGPQPTALKWLLERSGSATLELTYSGVAARELELAGVALGELLDSGSVHNE